MPEIRSRFEEVGPWRWTERESDRLGDYISSRVLPEPDEGMVKIFIEGDLFAVDFKLEAEAKKLDAVYDVPAGSELAKRGIRYQVVDWKTGKAPRDAHDLELKQTQLALYRLAYAKWADVAPETVDAVFYFVEDDRVIRPDRLYDEAALRRSWASVAGEAGPAPDPSSPSAASAPSRVG